MAEFAEQKRQALGSDLLRSSDAAQQLAPAHSLHNPLNLGYLSSSNQAAQRFAEICPLKLPSPGICPFGGACHACPGHKKVNA